MKCLKQFFTRYFKRNEFISAKKYNKLVKTEEGNCLSFAFGITQKSLINFDILTLDQIIKIQTYGELLEEVSICDQFTEKARLLGYKVKQVNNLEEAREKVAFIVIGFFTDYIEWIGDYPYFFHIIRKNEDETFEEKADWYSKASRISKSVINEWIDKGIPIYYFVLD